ncbi:MurG-like transferase [Crateriforma conspicua]|uniref:MurG-like transferase n=1 Tax=Crateriforma conspicua TaxID=2527996 RepID=A0A5C6FNB6_9PLAN|nr:glycosyltransferase [Crateriforma conspicua]TWU61873.1 MurG-like transferase [Crateriforma conspicua]
MNRPHVGFYVHYHGLGHKHRAEAIMRHLDCDCTVITSRCGDAAWSGKHLIDVMDLPSDIDDVPDHGYRHRQEVPALHYAPLWTDNITARVAAYTGWLQDAKPDLMVVDVSAEISMLTRLASIPQVVVRQHGRRDDDAHHNAYAAAISLLAPFPESWEDDITPSWVRQKTIYLNGFRREPEKTPQTIPQHERPTVVVMFGRGGHADAHAPLRSAANECPDFQWLVIGLDDDEHHPAGPANLSFLGWQESPQDIYRHADVVVTAAGHNSVMEIGSYRRPMIAIAQDRPFDEQIRKARILDREGLAVGLSRWPEAGSWPRLLDRARRLDTSQWDRVFQEDGAQQAASYLTSTAQWAAKQKRLQTETSPCPSV